MKSEQYLLSTSANRDWIMKSIEQADRGELKELKLPLQVLESSHQEGK